MKGISAIICCYNSENRIEKTLLGLSGQMFTKDIPFEIILVDNNSTDHTAIVAKTFWESLSSNFSFKILNEKEAGKVNAIKTGVLNASYEYILFLDDDNTVANNYAEFLFKTFESKPEVGIIGGLGALPETLEYQNIPDWWDHFKTGFAIGELRDGEGYLAAVPGAGMGLRKSAYLYLLDHNFNFVLSGRKGNTTISSGSDFEICYAVSLLGYKIWYEPKLNFVHHIERDRITLSYIKKLFVGHGNSMPYLNAYKYLVKGSEFNWFMQAFSTTYHLMVYFVKNIYYNFIPSHHRVLLIKMRLLTQKQRFKAFFSTGFNNYNSFCKEVKKFRKAHFKTRGA